jgi:SAM-dependent methyltransferase
METLLERIRRAELQPLRKYFPSGSRVLELGGGSGFQAAILSSWGCDVRSIDVISRPDPLSQRYGRQYFTITTYNGQHIPFADSSFDVVYSSHMLYHAVELDQMQAEIRRVLRPGGMAIHVLPSASWRFWTTLVHYPNLARKMLKRPSKLPGPSVAAHKEPPFRVPDSASHSAEPRTGLAQVSSVPISPRRRSAPMSTLSRARILLTVRPLGPSTDVFVEWSSFRKRRWRAAFLAAGFCEVTARRGPLFYTGHLMTPSLPFGLRSLLAVALGPASFAWTMRPPLEAEARFRRVTTNLAFPANRTI